MTGRASGSIRAPAYASGAALWLGGCAVAAAFDAAARGPSPTHAIFLVCATAPLLLPQLARRRLPPDAARVVEAIAWTLCGAALLLTADGAWAFAAWFAMPAIVTLIRCEPPRAAVEAGALGGLALVLAIALAGAGRPEWSYGALPLGSALGVAALALLAASRFAPVLSRVAGGQISASVAHAALVDASPDVFLVIGPDDRIVAGWGGGAGKLAADAASFTGRDAVSLFAPSDALRFARALDRVERGGEPERLVLAGDGGLIETRIVRHEKREMILVLRPASPEVEALPAAERERDAAEAASRARSRFFASMSHELRTPLNAVLGFSDAMRLKLFGPLHAKYAEYAEDINNSAKMLLDLVGDLLDVSRIEAGRYELEISRFDAREAAHAAARMMRPAADAGQVGFEVDVGETPIEVEADLRALKQMLLNLTSNAVKFTAAHGSVRVRLRAENGALVAEVSDTGPGLTPEDIDRIARPFEQTREGRLHASRGSGLGLALVRSLCELHEGRLEIESEPGVGATFRLRLPVLAGKDEPDESLDARGRLRRIKEAGFRGEAGGADS